MIILCQITVIYHSGMLQECYRFVPLQLSHKCMAILREKGHYGLPADTYTEAKLSSPTISFGSALSKVDF